MKTETKAKRNAWRPNAEDPKQTIQIGIETSRIDSLGGKKKVQQLAKEFLIKLSDDAKK